MKLSEDFIYQLKQANPIESIMSSYTNLKKRGRDYVCLCPFHSEKTPSCHVYLDSQSFYCFGCHAGGDVITFIMKSENLEYPEALHYLADKANIAFPDDDISDKKVRQKKRILEINKAAAKYFYKNFQTDEGKKGLIYLLDRGIKPETIKKYGLGFALNSWSSLKNYLTAEGFYENELVDAGLCTVSSKTNKYFDVFRNRVMFPIIDLRGNIIAFGGRKIDNSDERSPKYLNSSDTPVFKKSRNLFSLNFAKNEDHKRLILVEGYMDVVSVNQGGFPNVVATLGTALTPEQARLILQYTNEVILSYDSDGPGQKATERAISLLDDVGITTKILKIPGAKDPDEFIKKYGSTRFKLLLDSTQGAAIFQLKKCEEGLDMDSETDKLKYFRRATDVIATLSNPIERELYISKIASEQKISKDVIGETVNSKIKKNAKQKENKDWNEITSQTAVNRDKINPDAAKYPKEANAETQIIAFLFKHPDKAKDISETIKPEEFVTQFNKDVFTCLVSRIINTQDYSLSSFNSEFNIEQMGKISEILAITRNIDISINTVEDCIKLLKNHNSFSDKKGADMTDDELRDFVNNLSNKK